MATQHKKRLPAADFAELTGLSDRQLRNIAQKGFFPPPERGEYDEDESLRGMIRYQAELLKKKSSTLTEEKELLTRAKRETAEFELEVLRGRYVLIDEITSDIRSVAIHQRSHWAHHCERVLPAKLAFRPEAECLEIMKKAVDETCKIFSEGTRKWDQEQVQTSSET